MHAANLRTYTMKKRWKVLLILLAAVPLSVLALLQLPVFGGHPDARAKLEFAASAAFNSEQGLFQNRRPQLMAEMRENTSLGAMLKEWMKDRPNARPVAALPQQRPDIDAFMAAGDSPKVIWFGHSTFLLNMAGTTVLVDPIFSNAAAPFSFMVNRFQPPVLALDELPAIDVVLISHDHYDHLDLDTVKFFADSNTEFLTPLGISAHLTRWGISKDKITEYDWWQTGILHDITFTATPAQHFSGRDGFTENETLWAGWIIATASHKLFFSGDSGYDTHFVEIGQRHGPFALAFMDNGQYDKAWPAVHMFPDEVVRASRELKAERLLPVHWGMFELAFHDWKTPAEDVARFADAAGVELVTPILGQMITLDEQLTTTRWWQGLR